MLYTNRNLQTFYDMGYLMGSARSGMFGGGRYSFIENLRYFNSRGTWRLEGNMITGHMLSAVWAGELLVMIVFPLMVAYASVGLYLAEQGAWVQEKLMNYGFSAFDDEELDRIASGDIDVILQKPLEAQGEAMNALAVCYHKGDPTDFVALYKAGWDRDGALIKGRHVMTVKLGIDKIDALDAGLQSIHFPSPADKIAQDAQYANSTSASKETATDAMPTQVNIVSEEITASQENERDE